MKVLLLLVSSLAFAQAPTPPKRVPLTSAQIQTLATDNAAIQVAQMSVQAAMRKKDADIKAFSATSSVEAACASPIRPAVVQRVRVDETATPPELIVTSQTVVCQPKAAPTK